MPIQTAPAPERPRRPSIWRALVGLVLLGVVIAFAATHVDEERGLLQLFRRAHPGWLALALVLQAGTYLLAGTIWRQVLVTAGVRLPLGVFARLSLQKHFVDRVIPSGGLGGTLLVARSMTRRGVPGEVATTALLVDLLGYYIAFVVAVVAGVIIIAAHGTLPKVVVVVAVAFVVVAATMAGLIAFLTRRRAWVAPPWVRRIRPLAAALDSLAGASAELVWHPGLVARTALLQLGVLALDGSTLACTLLAVGQPLRPLAAFGSQALAQAAATVGIIPAGLGTYEAAAVATLALQGVPVASALAATLLLRGFSLWLPLLPGFLLARHDLLAT